MRWCGDGNEINIFALQYTPEIGVELFIVRPSHKLHVTQGELLDVEILAHALVGTRPTPTHANECTAKSLARRDLSGATHNMPRHNLAGRRRGHGGR